MITLATLKKSETITVIHYITNFLNWMWWSSQNSECWQTENHLTKWKVYKTDWHWKQIEYRQLWFYVIINNFITIHAIWVQLCSTEWSHWDQFLGCTIYHRLSNTQYVKVQHVDCQLKDHMINYSARWKVQAIKLTFNFADWMSLRTSLKLNTIQSLSAARLTDKKTD